MKRKKFMMFLFVLTMALVMVACNDSGSSGNTIPEDLTPGESDGGADPYADCPAVKLVTAHLTPDGDPFDLIADYFNERLQKETGGKLSLDIYPNAQLGNQVEQAAAGIAGDIQCAVSVIDANFGDKMAMLNLPMLINAEDEKVVSAFKESSFRDMLGQELENAGLHLIAVAPAYNKTILTNTYIDSMDDFKQLRIRTMEDSNMISMWENLGCSAMPLSVGDCYMAMQQGTFNAIDVSREAMVNLKFYDLSKYYVHTDTLCYSVGIWMNLDTYNSLPEAYRKLIDSLQDDIFDYAIKAHTDVWDANKAAMLDNVEEVYISDELRAEMIQACKPNYFAIREICGDEFMDTFLESIGQAGVYD